MQTSVEDAAPVQRGACGCWLDCPGRTLLPNKPSWQHCEVALERFSVQIPEMRKSAAWRSIPQHFSTKKGGMELEPPKLVDAQALHNACYHCGYLWKPRGLSRSVRCPRCTRTDWYVRIGPRTIRFKAIINELGELDQEDAGLIALRNEVILGPTELVPLHALFDYERRRGRRKALHDELRQLADEL